jgi:hypothetical protein
VPPVIQRARVITKACGSRSLDSLRLGIFAMSFGGFTVYLRAPISACTARILLLISPAMAPGRQKIREQTRRVRRPRSSSSRQVELVALAECGLSASPPIRGSMVTSVQPASTATRWPAQTSYDLSKPLICTNDRKRPPCTSFTPGRSQHLSL